MSSGPERYLLDAVRPERMARLCADLVRIPTVSPYSGDAEPSGELAGQVLVERVLRHLGATVERVPCNDDLFGPAGVLAPAGRISADRPNIVATVTLGTGNGPCLVIDAHMDTVGVDHYEGDPFAGEIRDGFIHGRGASDDKQGVTIMIEAVRALLESGCPCNGTIICCSVVDEECDGAGRGTLACLNHIGPMDAALVLDGAAGGVWAGCTGVITAEVSVSGRAGHAALGASVNAIEKAVALFAGFDAFRDARGRRPGDFNVGVFEAGDHPANVPNSARMGLNIKTTIDDMRAARAAHGVANGRLVRELFETCVAQASADDTFLRERPAAIRWIKDVPAAEPGPEAAQLLQLVARASTEIRGIPPTLAPLNGWGDVSHFINAGIPALGLGAGHAGAAHGASEKVAIDDLVATGRIVALTLYRLLTSNGNAHA